MDNYNDIIDLEHYEPKFHKRMSRYNRAAQFSSFAALKGYEELVEEKARITDKEIQLTEEEKTILNNKLSYINNKIDEHPKIKITYFIKDNKKSGGMYKRIEKQVKKIDITDNYIKFIDNSIINIYSIVNIDGDIFKSVYF